MKKLLILLTLMSTTAFADDSFAFAWFVGSNPKVLSGKTFATPTPCSLTISEDKAPESAPIQDSNYEITMKLDNYIFGPITTSTKEYTKDRRNMSYSSKAKSNNQINSNQNGLKTKIYMDSPTGNHIIGFDIITPDSDHPITCLLVNPKYGN